MNTNENEIIHIEKKLEEMRVRYRSASPVMRGFLVSGAKVLNHKLMLLKKVKETPQALF